MPKALLRSDIEQALDELEAYEEGMRFQSLGVVLAKQRWPSLVAAERRNDLGLDALVTGKQASDGVGRGLACSITAEYAKIAADAEKVKKRFGDQIQTLVFATSGKVSTARKVEWIKEIRTRFGLELEVMSREDIITSLTAPENVGLCRTYLGLDLEVEPSLATIVQDVRAAAREEASNWARHLTGQPLIPLQATSIESDGAESETVWSLEDIEKALRDARRIVVEAPAGCGKTTTLIQLASGVLSAEGSVFFIDLPSWIRDGSSILTFIAGMPVFQRRGITSQQLAEAGGDERFYFLLNGWNEVAASSSNDATIFTRDLERQFPSAGIIVATRAHYVSPPLPGATRIRLRRVPRRSRQEYIRQRLGNGAPPLLTAIDTDKALDELTRTPFVLSAVTTLVAAGQEIPRSRVGVMDAVVLLMEKSAEHELFLTSAPLQGMADEYLQALAMEMVGANGVSVTDRDARGSVNWASSLLAEDGLINQLPQPADVLNALCAHHLLERIEYPNLSYRFEHQLFLEYYASHALRRTLATLALSKSTTDTQMSFVEDFVNEPIWTEPLRMVAEKIRDEKGSSNSNGAKALGQLLATIVLAVDPIFAAELISLGGIAANDPVAVMLEQKLREWHSSSDVHHRTCAFAGMLASGLGSFRDIIEPVLASDDRQVRLHNNRWFSVSTLGEDWRKVIAAWPEEARADFVSETLHQQFIPELSAFALGDRSEAVKLAAMDALSWTGAEEEFTAGANGLNDDDFALLLQRIPADHLPISLQHRARLVLGAHLRSQTDRVQRMQTLLKLNQVKDADAVAKLKEELDRYPTEKAEQSAEHIVRTCLEAVRVSDPDWASEWVAIRIANGQLWPEWWRQYLRVIPNQLRDEQVDRITTQDLEHVRLEGSILIAAHDEQPSLAKRAFGRLVEIWDVLNAVSEMPPKVEWDLHRQTESLLRAMTPNIVLSGLNATMEGDPTLSDVTVLSHLYGQIGQTSLRSPGLDAGVRKVLTEYLLRGQELILGAKDPAGEVKANFSSLLSQVGGPENITAILSNVRADLERVRSGRNARARGDRSELADYSSTSQTHSYVRSIVTLLGDNADAVLLELLSEMEYEAPIIDEFGRQFDQPWFRSSVRNKPYEQIWKARESPQEFSDGVRRDQVADAIRSRMKQLESTKTEDKDSDQHRIHRLKKLALGLAQTAPKRFADSILKTMSQPARFDGWMRVDALERLLFSGAPLPADVCLSLLDAPLEDMKSWGVQNQDRWLLIRYLCICPYVTPQAEGVAKIRGVMSQAHLSVYDFRDVLPSLGYSRFAAALTLMREFVPTVQYWKAIEHEWVKALTTLDIPEARSLTLSFVDPELTGLPFTLDSGPADAASARIAEIAATDALVDARLRELSLVPLDDSKRHLLIKSLAARGTPEAVLAILNVVDDKSRDRIPWEIRRFLEHSFVKREPYAGLPNTFTLKASASNAVRTKLFQMVFDDENRKRSAYSLLGQIEEWRLEYGRPVDEPRHPALESGLPWPPPEPI